SRRGLRAGSAEHRTETNYYPCDFIPDWAAQPFLGRNNTVREREHSDATTDENYGSTISKRGSIPATGNIHGNRRLRRLISTTRACLRSVESSPMSGRQETWTSISSCGYRFPEGIPYAASGR